jgi:hypothetical protein
MASAAEYTDPYLHTYTPVPAAGPGVCPTCYSGPGTGYGTCFSCTSASQQVSQPTRHVVPISLYTMNSQLWHVLRFYKDGTGPSSGMLATQVAAIIARFTARHLACVAALLGGQPDIVTTVPSTRVPLRPGRHPLQDAVARAGALAALQAPLLIRGPAPVDHNSAADDVFAVRGRLSGQRVLIVDDTLTTGARLQSAASALHLGGASAVAAIVAGRVINPDWNENSRLIWNRARETPFSFSQCCLCRS